MLFDDRDRRPGVSGFEKLWRPTLRVIEVMDLGQHPDRRHRSGTELFARVIFAIRELIRVWNGYATQTLAIEGDDLFDGFPHGVVAPDLAGVGLPLRYKHRPLED